MPQKTNPDVMQRLNAWAGHSLGRLTNRFPRAIAYYRYLREGYFIFAEPVTTPLGFRLAGDARMESGQYEPTEVAILGGLLAETDVFINIGANIGYFALLAAQMNVPTVAFEPLDANLKLLYKNVAANGWQDRVEIFPLALGDQTGLVDLFGGHTGASLIPGWAGTPPHHRRLVPCSTLDTVLGDRFHGQRCTILVDIEGVEFAMLAGAAGILAQSPKPIWLMEIQTSNQQPGGVGFNPHFLSTFELFWEAGYAAWTAEIDPRPIHPEQIRQVWQEKKPGQPTLNYLFKSET